MAASQCFDDAPENVVVAYPVLDTSKWFRLMVTYDRFGDLGDNPSVHVSYAVHVTQLPDEHEHDMTSYPDLSTTSDGSGVVPGDEAAATAAAAATATLLENTTDVHDNDIGKGAGEI